MKSFKLWKQELKEETKKEWQEVKEEFTLIKYFFYTLKKDSRSKKFWIIQILNILSISRIVLLKLLIASVLSFLFIGMMITADIEVVKLKIILANFIGILAFILVVASAVYVLKDIRQIRKKFKKLIGFFIDILLFNIFSLLLLELNNISHTGLATQLSLVGNYLFYIFIFLILVEMLLKKMIKEQLHQEQWMIFVKHYEERKVKTIQQRLSAPTSLDTAPRAVWDTSEYIAEIVVSLKYSLIKLHIIEKEPYLQQINSQVGKSDWYNAEKHSKLSFNVISKPLKYRRTK
jgi:hypothetical protein